MATYDGIIYDLLTPTQTWEDSVFKKQSNLIPKIFDMWYQFLDTVYSPEIVVSGGSSFFSDLSFALLNGQILEVADYAPLAEIKEDGGIYTGGKCDVVYNNALKQVRCRIKSGQTVGGNEYIYFRWRWDNASGRYRDVGFYQFDYDYSVYYKTGNWFRETEIDGTTYESNNSINTTVPSAIRDKCNEDVSYPATNVYDLNSATEWRHGAAEDHFIVLDMSAGKRVGAVDIYYTGVKGNTWTVKVEVAVPTHPGLRANSSGCSSFVLQDSDATFQTWGIGTNDGIYNVTQGVVEAVTGVSSETSLTTDQLAVGDYNNDYYEIHRFTTAASGVSISGSAGWKHIPFNIVDNVRFVRITIASTDGAGDPGLYDFGEVQVSTFLHKTVPVKGLRWEVLWYDSAAPHTSDGFEFLDIRNAKVTRYEEIGNGEATIPLYFPNIDTYDSVWLDAVLPFYPCYSVDFPEGIDVGVQLSFSDDGAAWTNFAGPGGFSTTYFRMSPNYNGNGTRFIDVPGGITGYYVKWKFFLFSDGRDTPILDWFSIFAWLFNYQKELTTIASTHPSYGSASPVMNVPIDLKLSTVYSRLINFPSGVELTPVDLLLTHSLAGVHIDLFSGIDRYAKFWLSVSTWLESVVGQVVSGYVRDQNENIILNGFKVVITSTYAFGLDSMGTVDPPTGFYQLFIKSTIYDNRWLMAALNTGKTFDIAYRKYGLPDLIDGTAPLVSPQDLHFWVPSQICGKSVAYVGSLVTY